MTTFQTINPYRQEVLSEYPYTTPAQLTESLAKAKAAFPAWRNAKIADRAAFVLQLAGVLREEKAKLALLATREMGKPLQEAQGELEKCAWLCEYYAEQAEEALLPAPVDGVADETFVRYMPIGGVLGVMPWNFPYWQIFRFMIPSLLVGNTVFVKPALNTAGCALEIAKLLQKVGLPEGVLQVVLPKHEDIPVLIESPHIQGIALTGSERAGSTVAALAGKHIKKTVLELGGSDPFIVLPDADLEQTARMGLLSRMMNNGQSCIAAKRFIVHESISQEFQEILCAKIEKLKLGNPEEEGTNISCLARPDLADLVEDQLKRSIAAGAKVIVGGKRENNRILPTLLVDVNEENPAFREEVFGPVLPMMTFKTAEEAIRIANNTAYGLGASVWSGDPEAAAKIAMQLDAGSVSVNQIVKSDPRIPFGGTKLSGYGRELATEGLHEFCNVQALSVKYEA